MTPKPPRPKPCKVCKQKFQPTRSIQPVCDSYECKVKYAEAHALKANKKRIAQETIKKRARRAETKKRKDAIKPRSKWLSECQDVFNKFIRLRDANEPCISCGREHVEWTIGGAWDCGHFLGRGAKPELRFEELNAWKQCKSCNGGSGKYARKNYTVSKEYRERLIAKIGLDKVLWLEGPHEPKHYTIDDLIALKAHYTQRCKELIKLQGE